MSNLQPRTGNENNIASRAEILANATRELAKAAGDLALEAKRFYQREQDITDRLEFVQSAFWYAVHHKMDERVLAVIAESLGFPDEQWRDLDWVSMEVDKRGLRDTTPPPGRKDGAYST